MTARWQGGDPPDWYLERYQAEHPRLRGVEWLVVLIVVAIVLCLLAAKIVNGA